MIKLKNYLHLLCRNTISSIAFYPTIISIGFFLLAILALTLEKRGLTTYLLDVAPFLVINDADTARTILSTFIGGLLSLTVFSFSMVMLILSQASSNYSPRLLPELISNKRHQIVLGFYLGTIIYAVLVLISILPNGDAYTLPGAAVLLGIVLGITCLGMFVYFIHSISQEIQITFVLKRIFNRTKKRLKQLEETEKSSLTVSSPSTNDWQNIYGTQNGYFQGISQSTILELAETTDTVFKVLPIKGLFVLRSVPVLKSKKKLDEETRQKVLSCLQYSTNPDGENNYVFGIKQITEIAVKAMSPGINDPGTAINAIDYLTELLAIRLKLHDKDFHLDESQQLRLIQTTVDFEDLLYNILASLRQYCKHDVVILQKLLMMLKYLSKEKVILKAYQKAIEKEINILVNDAELFIKNEQDLAVLKKLAATIKI